MGDRAGRQAHIPVPIAMLLMATPRPGHTEVRLPTPNPPALPPAFLVSLGPPLAPALAPSLPPALALALVLGLSPHLFYPCPPLAALDSLVPQTPE